MCIPTRLLPLLWIAATTTAAARAQTSPIDSLLDMAVVTGTRSAKTLDNTPVHTRLIKAEQIQQSGATHLHELLQHELPGIEFTYALSGHLNMNMAGFAGQGVLFLLDGERLAGETMDNIDFARINLSNVERIEMVKGAASALYGSNAAGGVINIITRGARHTPTPWSLTLDAKHARHNNTRVGSVWNVRRQRWAQTFDVQHTRSDSYRLHNPIDATLYTKYALSQVLGGQTWNVKERVQWQPSEALRLTGRASYYFRERNYDAGEHNRYRDFAGGLRGEWNMAPQRKLDISYAFDQYDKSDFYLATRLDVRDYSNVQHTLRALYTEQLSETAEFIAGSDLQRDYLRTYQFADGQARTQWSSSLFAQVDWMPTAQWEVLAALRGDHYSHESGVQPTGKLSVRYRHEALTLRAGYGNGFRAPSLKERFMLFPINDIFIIRGHEHLKAERSHNFHTSIEWTRRHTHLTAALGYNIVCHRITTSPPSSERDAASHLPFIDYINLPRLRVLSAEATAQHHWSLWRGKLKAQANYAYTHEQVGSVSTLTPYLPARPHSATARLDFDRQFSKRYGLNLLLSARWLSSLQGEEFNHITGASHRITYPSYALVRLATSHRIGRALRLNLAADNLLNYRPHIYYYNSPPTAGIDLSLGITLDLHAL